MGNKGFGLIQVLVALGLMGILMFGMMTLLTNFQKESSLGKSKIGFLNLGSDLRLSLGTTDVCTTSFSGKQLSSAVVSDAAAKFPLGSGGSGFTVPSLPALKDGASISTYDIVLGSIYLTNRLDAGNSPTPGNKYYLFDLMISGGSAMKTGASATRSFKDMVATKLKFEVDGARRIVRCSVAVDNPLVTPSPSPLSAQRCAYSVFKDRPWVRRSINCQNNYKGTKMAVYDFIHERDGEVVYRDFQVSDPLTLRFNATTGAYISKSGDSAGSMGADCMQNLKSISDNTNNACD